MSTCTLEYCLVSKGELKEIILQGEQDAEALKETFTQWIEIPGYFIEQLDDETRDLLFAKLFADLCAQFPGHVAVYPRAVYDQDGEVLREYTPEEAAAFMPPPMQATFLSNLLRRAADLLN